MRTGNDPTQGPKCALACPGGTVFRNYLVNGAGQGETQIDLLVDVGKVLGNRYECYWTMQNGYAMSRNMRGLALKLEASPRLIEDAEAALRVGVHCCVEINQCVGCTRQFFTRSFLGDGVAALAPSSGAEPTSPRHRAGVASMAWRTTR